MDTAGPFKGDGYWNSRNPLPQCKKKTNKASMHYE